MLTTDDARERELDLIQLFDWRIREVRLQLESLLLEVREELRHDHDQDAEHPPKLPAELGALERCAELVGMAGAGVGLRGEPAAFVLAQLGALPEHPAQARQWQRALRALLMEVWASRCADRLDDLPLLTRLDTRRAHEAPPQIPDDAPALRRCCALLALEALGARLAPGQLDELAHELGQVPESSEQARAWFSALRAYEGIVGVAGCSFATLSGAG